MNLTSSNSQLKVLILAIVYALAFAATPMMMLLGGLIGAELAPSPDWATLPVAVMIVGTAIGVYPATRVMQRWGRRNGLWLFLAIGIFAYYATVQSLAARSFFLFCLCAIFIGFSNAAVQQIRFAAMECVSEQYAAAAASIVLCSGVVAAFLGPELALIGREFSDIPYQGSFYLIAACAGGAAIVLLFYKQTGVTAYASHEAARPIKTITANPIFWLALCSGIVGFSIMTFVMTGTPISMHNHHGHSLVDTKWVVQSHIAAMYLPSLAVPLLFRLIGMRGVIVAGLVCYAVTIIVGHLNTSVAGFWIQLVALGIGWNFLFVAGTTLLPKAYKSGEAFKVQALNDGAVFSTQAMASLFAGWAISSMSWQVYLVICLIPMLLMTAVLFWSKAKQKTL